MDIVCIAPARNQKILLGEHLSNGRTHNVVVHAPSTTICLEDRLKHCQLFDDSINNILVVWLVGRMIIIGGGCGLLRSRDLGSRDLGSRDLGSGNLGSGNLGSRDLGSRDLGSGNLGSGNLGSGNLGSRDLGSGDLGSGNLGSGNLGSGD
ncbi:MAG: hypothetical protein E7584_06295, partial [Ruminococcaceae bacterium]|nr:hypothetical protein [Oscillospiraceae bacterium]